MCSQEKFHLVVSSWHQHNVTFLSNKNISKTSCLSVVLPAWFEDQLATQVEGLLIKNDHEKKGTRLSHQQQPKQRSFHQWIFVTHRQEEWVAIVGYASCVLYSHYNIFSFVLSALQRQKTSRKRDVGYFDSESFIDIYEKYSIYKLGLPSSLKSLTFNILYTSL